MSNPRIPFTIPNDENVQTSDQPLTQMEYPLTQDGFWGSHSGRQRRWDSERPRALADTSAPKHLFEWEEEWD